MAEEIQNDADVIHLTASEIVDAFQLPLSLRKWPEFDNVPSKYKRRTVIRIGSWNLLSFTKQKAKNPGVREVICMTILQHGYV